jgi:hypothetical protein
MTEAAVAPVSEQPWEPSRSVAAQLAIGSLAKFFLKSLTQNGRVQLETLFCSEPIVPVPDFKLVAPRDRPLLLAAVAASYMPAMKASLPPVLAMKIFMEAAIPMSKIDQSSVHFVGTPAQ